MRINLFTRPADSLLLVRSLNPVFALDIARHSDDERNSRVAGDSTGSMEKTPCTSSGL